MPCMCWYNPGNEDKARFKEACEKVVAIIKELEIIGDPLDCTLEDACTLLKHLYSGKCDRS